MGIIEGYGNMIIHYIDISTVLLSLNSGMGSLNDTKPTLARAPAGHCMHGLVISHGYHARVTC